MDASPPAHPSPPSRGSRETTPHRLSERTRQVMGWVAIVLHCTVVAFPYYGSPLVAPLWGTLVLWALWVGLLVLAIHLLRRRSPWALAVPVVALALWFALITLGDVFLGWTA